MSFFNSIFGNSEKTDSQKKNVSWVNLTDLAQLNEVITVSNKKPVIIFKHSTKCSISRMALKQFESEFDLNDIVEAYFLDLIVHRDISNEIANRFDVDHQSPQLILIQNEKAIYNVSHNDIDAVDLKEKIEFNP